MTVSKNVVKLQSLPTCAQITYAVLFLPPYSVPIALTISNLTISYLAISNTTPKTEQFRTNTNSNFRQPTDLYTQSQI
jgi:hypothetical protein